MSIRASAGWMRRSAAISPSVRPRSAASGPVAPESRVFASEKSRASGIGDESVSAARRARVEGSWKALRVASGPERSVPIQVGIDEKTALTPLQIEGHVDGARLHLGLQACAAGSLELEAIEGAGDEVRHRAALEQRRERDRDLVAQRELGQLVDAGAQQIGVPEFGQDLERATPFAEHPA